MWNETQLISDTLRTHIRGVLSRHSDWSSELDPFEAEAAWIIGDWSTVKKIGERASPVPQALLALQEGQQVETALRLGRRQIGAKITSDQYSRSYDIALQLHLLRDIEIIHTADTSIRQTRDALNGHPLNQKTVRSLDKALDERFLTTSPSFRVREGILGIRRTALGLASNPHLKPQIGAAWIQSSKIARKAGYEQTAYSASLQAKVAGAPFAFLQQAKLLRAHGGVYKAFTELENAIAPLLEHQVIDLTDDQFVRDRNLAKVGGPLVIKLNLGRPRGSSLGRRDQ